MQFSQDSISFPQNLFEFLSYFGLHKSRTLRSSTSYTSVDATQMQHWLTSTFSKKKKFPAPPRKILSKFFADCRTFLADNPVGQIDTLSSDSIQAYPAIPGYTQLYPPLPCHAANHQLIPPSTSAELYLRPSLQAVANYPHTVLTYSIPLPILHSLRQHQPLGYTSPPGYTRIANSSPTVSHNRTSTHCPRGSERE